jgi:hypothetical protein
MASSVGSPRFDYPELPSSPNSLISNGWSYPDPPDASEVVPARHLRHSPLSASQEVPDIASSSILTSAISPQDQSIPFQFLDSIFEETLSDDGTEVDATWNSDDGPVSHILIHGQGWMIKPIFPTQDAITIQCSSVQLDSAFALQVVLERVLR